MKDIDILKQAFNKTGVAYHETEMHGYWYLFLVTEKDQEIDLTLLISAGSFFEFDKDMNLVGYS